MAYRKRFRRRFRGRGRRRGFMSGGRIRASRGRARRFRRYQPRRGGILL